MPSEETTSESYRVLVADDEPDMLAVTKLSLRGMRRGGRKVELLSASSGREAVEVLRSQPDISVVLLDVVMENDHAGLDACKAIRGELKNPFVRILLRTGQPGAAPERQTIDEYDIDGYLPKAELTSSRLYTVVRTALKAHDELMELERHRRHLEAIHDCVLALRPFEPLEGSLERVLATASTLCPSPLSALHLETFEEKGNPRHYFLFRAAGGDGVQAEAQAQAVRAAVTRAQAGGGGREAGPIEGGYLVPLRLHRELGHGWIYVQRPELDALTRLALPVLAAQASNALYASVAQAMLKARQGAVFDEMDI